MAPSKTLYKIDVAWRNNYKKLVGYKNRTGTCNVPSKDPEMGEVRCQRNANNKGQIRNDRKKKLDSIGFDWSPNSSVRNARSEAAWELMYEQLKEYKDFHGNCRLPSTRALKKNENNLSENELKHMRKLVSWTHQQRLRRKVTAVQDGFRVKSTTPPLKGWEVCRA